jgi:hypothetical protein
MSTTEPKADDDQDETTNEQTARENTPGCGRRDRDEDLPPQVGEKGILVTCRCVGCKTVRRKLAPVEILEKEARHPSFQHICHDCQRVQWHNIIEILDDVDQDDQEGAR